jgi:hypothetical protein
MEFRVASTGYDARSTIIYEGHLINFLVLIRDVLFYTERPTLDLTSVWETLETMMSAFSISQSSVSISARTRFEEVHNNVREFLYVSNRWGTCDGSDKVSFMPISLSLDNPNMSTVDGLTTNIATLRPPNKSPKVQKNLPAYAAERYSQLLEFMDKIAKGLRLVDILSANLAQPAAGEPFPPTSELHLRHGQIFTKDPFRDLDVLNAFSSALPALISPTSQVNARDTVEKMIIVDGLLRSINGHLETSVNPEVPRAMRERIAMTSLQALNQVFTLLEGSTTVRWYEVGMDAVLDSASVVTFSGAPAGDLSAIHACCVLGIINHVVIDQLRLRDAEGQQLTAQNLEEQLFILKVFDLLCLGNREERARRQDRRQGHPDTNKEASSPRYLRSLHSNGHLQNFSILASRMIDYLDEEIPELMWTTLRKLKDVPGLEEADDIALHYLAKVRIRAYDAVLRGEKSTSYKSFDLLDLVNTVCSRLELPELRIPMPVIPPGTLPTEFVAPVRSGYAPIYI